MANFEVISAFLDDEPFDPQALSGALADPDGRALLIDLLTLRRLMQPDGTSVQRGSNTRRVPTPVRVVLAAAALTLAVAGGYQLGERSGSPTPSMEAPSPTRVVPTEGAWREVTEGGAR